MQAPDPNYWPTILNWVLGGVSTIILVLTGAIATMWKSEKQSNCERIEALEKSSASHIGQLELKLAKAEAAEEACRETYAKLLVEFARLETRLVHLEQRGCVAPSCPRYNA